MNRHHIHDIEVSLPSSLYTWTVFSPRFAESHYKMFIHNVFFASSGIVIYFLFDRGGYNSRHASCIMHGLDGVLLI